LVHAGGCLFVVLAFCFTLFFTNSAAASPPAAQLLKVVLDDNYPPYIFRDARGALQGILVDQWRLFGERNGLRVELFGMDWGEALARMASGDFDVIDTIFRNEDREKVFDFSEPYAPIDVPIFFRSDLSGIRDAESLHGFRVAAKKGDNAVWFLRNRGVTDIVEFDSYEKIIEAARSRDVAVFVVDQPPAHYFLYRLGVSEEFRQTEPLYGGKFHRAVRKGDVATLRLLEKGFGAITASEYREIDRRWLGKTISGSGVIRYLQITLVAAGIVSLFLLVMIGALRRMVRTRTGVTTIPIRWHRKKDGTVFPVEIRASHFEWRGRRVHIAAIRDVTERQGAEEQLRFLGFHDAMTGLYNRTYFEEELDRLDHRRDGAVGILVTDVDGLKLVNDTLGHEKGDALLVETARVLEDVVRKSDMVARIGGDEFTILLPGADESLMEEVVGRIGAALCEREANAAECAVAPRLSLGWAISADSGTPMRTAFRVADDRMYRDKLRRKGSGRSAFLRTITTLLSERDHRDDVVRELREGAGIRFDPDLAARVVDVLLSTEEKQAAD
jgi:diguanylate cyclase (GGDEF)-like protein